ncbi:DUF1049 domain-containing protein [Rhizobium sp. CFBP 8762]|uniref:DUF1049 domain-containing protein n=1 Tax=Rhizobium sp. CFBP 8762 TaxID=2775279 RepID=UPI001784402E|nr:DUF1049 domain-containing protein [Rhizobium sp. CFBP 8762]MBD8553696.1 DUF1049 domain-containing protein [Rhizobium sp. CFBP 8762]
MQTFKKLINLVVLLPIGIVLIMLAVANRKSVTLALNPFNPEDTVLSASGPFFLFLFLSLILGMVIGALATWVGQGKYRNRARKEAHEAVKWHEEAAKHKARHETASRGLVPVSSQ